MLFNLPGPSKDSYGELMALYCDDMPDDITDDDNAELAPLERRLEILERLEEAARGKGLPSLLMELRYELMVLVLESFCPVGEGGGWSPMTITHDAL